MSRKGKHPAARKTVRGNCFNKRDAIYDSAVNQNRPKVGEKSGRKLKRDGIEKGWENPLHLRRQTVSPPWLSQTQCYEKKSLQKRRFGRPRDYVIIRKKDERDSLDKR